MPTLIVRISSLNLEIPTLNLEFPIFKLETPTLIVQISTFKLKISVLIIFFFIEFLHKSIGLSVLLWHSLTTFRKLHLNSGRGLRSRLRLELLEIFWKMRQFGKLLDLLKSGFCPNSGRIVSWLTGSSFFRTKNKTQLVKLILVLHDILSLYPPAESKFLKVALLLLTVAPKFFKLSLKIHTYCEFLPFSFALMKFTLIFEKIFFLCCKLLFFPRFYFLPLPNVVMEQLYSSHECLKVLSLNFSHRIPDIGSGKSRTPD